MNFVNLLIQKHNSREHNILTFLVVLLPIFYTHNGILKYNVFAIYLTRYITNIKIITLPNSNQNK